MTVRGAFDKKNLSGRGEGTEESPFIQNTESMASEEMAIATLRELKKINFYLHIMTDTDIKDMEIG